VEWTQILDGVLKLDFEMAIPGRGDPKTRAEVESYRKNFAALIARATEAIKGGAVKRAACDAGQDRRSRVAVQSAVLRPVVRRVEEIGGSGPDPIDGGPR
jgi:hypothetical protein